MVPAGRSIAAAQAGLHESGRQLTNIWRPVWARRLVPEVGPMIAAARGTGGERWAAASAGRPGPVWSGRL